MQLSSIFLVAVCIAGRAGYAKRANSINATDRMSIRTYSAGPFGWTTFGTTSLKHLLQTVSTKGASHGTLLTSVNSDGVHQKAEVVFEEHRHLSDLWDTINIASTATSLSLAQSYVRGKSIVDRPTPATLLHKRDIP